MRVFFSVFFSTGFSAAFVLFSVFFCIFSFLIGQLPVTNYHYLKNNINLLNCFAGGSVYQSFKSDIMEFLSSV